MPHLIANDLQLQSPLRNLCRSALLQPSLRFLASLKRRPNGSRVVVVAGMFFLWTAMWALEISPALHQLLHKDAQSPGHNCLVTQLQRSLVESAFATALAPAPPPACSCRLSCADFQFYPSYDYRLTPSRGPPAV